MARIIIPKKDLIKLYYGQKKSKYKIGEIYNCSFKTVLNRMREYGMEPLSRSIIQSKYPKKDFCGDNNEKAYMIGFRLGDLSVFQTVSHSDVIIVGCHTTRDEQVQLVKKIFSKYGRVSVSINDKSKNINCYLNKSFSFLLSKEDRVEEWISKHKKYSDNFAAGYTDAEGNIGIYDGRARFKIDSYDKNIIFWMYDWLSKNSIICPPPTLIGKKGQIYDKLFKYKYNKDLWRIRISRMDSLYKLLFMLKPLLKHKKRKEHLRKCLKNINDRTK